MHKENNDNIIYSTILLPELLSAILESTPEHNQRNQSCLRLSVHSAAIFANTSGQLKQDQVLSKWMRESWNLKNCSLKSQLNYIFQISNKIWNELPHECSFLCTNSVKKAFQARAANAHAQLHDSYACACVLAALASGFYGNLSF